MSYDDIHQKLTEYEIIKKVCSFIDIPYKCKERTLLMNEISTLIGTLSHPSDEFASCLITLDLRDSAAGSWTGTISFLDKIKINSFSTESQLKFIARYPVLISTIKNISEEFLNHAIKANVQAITFVNNPSIECVKRAMSFDRSILFKLSSLSNLPEDFIVSTIKKSPEITNNFMYYVGVQYIHDCWKTEAVQLALLESAIKTNKRISASDWLRAFKTFKNPSEKVLLKLLSISGTLLDRIKNPTEEMQILAVSKAPSMFKTIKNPSAAVKDAYFRRTVFNDSSDIARIHEQS